RALIEHVDDLVHGLTRIGVRRERGEVVPVLPQLVDQRCELAHVPSPRPTTLSATRSTCSSVSVSARRTWCAPSGPYRSPGAAITRARARGLANDQPSVSRSRSRSQR